LKTICYNAAVYTGTLPLQEAFGVEDDRFFFVGTNDEARKETADRFVDLKGAFVCAGFNDSHMHLLNYGQALTIAPLHKNTGSLEEMLQCLKQTAPGRGCWILGRGWNQDYFSDVNRMPNRWDLDRVSIENPVCAVRACGHALSVNSKALEILGITGETPQIEGGQIVMEDGQPNGIFFDNAMDLVYDAFPAPEKEDLKSMIQAACAALNAYGITSVQSDDYCVFRNVPWQTLKEAFQELEQSGELTVRVYEQANFTDVDSLAEFVEAGNITGTGTDFFRIGPLKMLGDGALGARTAFLSQPYADAPDTQGISVFSQQEFDDLIGYANAHNMQCAIHCIGDGCLDMVLSSLGKALAEYPRKDHRHGIVHCQITRPDQLDKIAAMGLHVYAQSIFLDYDIHMVQERVGEKLASSSYSWKTLQKMGATVSNGSDCPVELPNVLAGIQCAVTRTDLKGSVPAYLPNEAFTLQEAIDSFTSGAAYASFEEHHKGSIQPGMLADFVVLDQNPFLTSVSQLRDISVLETWIGGKTVYKKS